MINHLRTLLMNVSRNSSDFQEFPGDEFIDPDFLPVVARGFSAPGLQQIRDLLFGISPDRLFLNFRVQQIMGLLESTDLRDYVKYHDRRITYRANDTSFFDKLTFQPRVTGGTVVNAVHLSGTPNSPDTLGISNHRFSLSVIGNSLTVSVSGRFISETAYTLSYTDGFSQAIPLPGTGLGFRLEQSKVVNGGATIVVWLRPTLNLADLEPKFKRLPAETYTYLFGQTAVEPYLTFKNCWESHPQLPYRMAGILLAYAFRLSELHESRM